MTKEKLAALLNGREYGKEITKNEEAQAKTAGLVVIFGYSDDNVELRGAIHDEVGAYQGTTVRITGDGELLRDFEILDKDDEAELECYFKAKAKGFCEVEAIFDKEGYTWIYKTDVPHATFEIMEDTDTYCRGIVINIADLVQTPVAITQPPATTRADHLEAAALHITAANALTAETCQ